MGYRIREDLRNITIIKVSCAWFRFNRELERVLKSGSRYVALKIWEAFLEAADGEKCSRGPCQIVYVSECREVR